MDSQTFHKSSTDQHPFTTGLQPAAEHRLPDARPVFVPRPSMTWPHSPRMTISFIVVLIVLLVNGVVVYRTATALHDAHGEVQRAYEIVAKNKKISLWLRAAESGVHGFVLTGSEEYLQAFHDAERQLPATLESLETLVIANEPQSVVMDEIQAHVQARMKLLSDEIRVRSESGIAGVTQFLRSGVGKRAMDQANGSISQLTTETSQILRTRTQYAAHALFTIMAANLCMVGVGIVVSGMAWRLIDGHVQQSLQAESRADAERENLLVTLASIADAVVVTDADGRVQMANPVAQELMGVDSSVTGKRLDQVFAVVHELTNDPVPNPVDEVLKLGNVVGSVRQTLLIRPDGTQVPIEENAAPIRNRAGVIAGVVLVFRDCSERRRFEQNLLEREQHVSRMLQTPLIGIAVCAGDGITLLEANDAFLSLIGQTSGMVAGSTLSWDGALPSRGPLDEAAQEELRQTGICRPFEKSCRRRDGKVVPVLISANKLFQEEDRIVVFVMDLSESKRSEASLKESENRFLTLAESMPQIVWLAKHDGSINYINQNWATYAGRTTEDLSGWGWADLLHPDDKVSHLQAWKKSLGTSQPFEAEHRLRHHTGDYRWHLTRALPMYNDAGHIIQWVGTTTDIHDHKQVEALLMEEHQRKDQFLAMLAHELRNPLAPMANVVEVLSANTAKESLLPELLPIMKRQIRVLTRLIDDLLDVARLTQGRITLKRKPTLVASIIKAAVETSQATIDESQHQLIVAESSADLWVDGDFERLVQVVRNLLQNAARYTKRKGQISLHFDQSGDDVFIRVRDNGQGIARPMMSQIFELFTHAEPTLDRVPGGLGIGLSLVRTLVQLHGGEVTAYSEGAGLGSEFIVRLPLITAPRKLNCCSDNAVGSATDPPQARRILVVDDVKASAKTLAMMLKALGHDAEIVFDGPSAITRIMESEFDVVFLDIAMPGMDGLEVARYLRARPAFAGLVLIALTGFGQDDDRDRSLNAGFNYHLIKPTSLNALQEVLQLSSKASVVKTC